MKNFYNDVLINVLPSLPMENDMDRFIVAKFVLENARDIASKPDIAGQVLQGLFTAQGAYNHVLKDGETAPDFSMSVDMRALLSKAEDVLSAAIESETNPLSLPAEEIIVDKK